MTPREHYALPNMVWTTFRGKPSRVAWPDIENKARWCTGSPPERPLRIPVSPPLLGRLPRDQSGPASLNEGDNKGRHDETRPLSCPSIPLCTRLAGLPTFLLSLMFLP